MEEISDPLTLPMDSNNKDESLLSKKRKIEDVEDLDEAKTNGLSTKISKEERRKAKKARRAAAKAEKKDAVENDVRPRQAVTDLKSKRSHDTARTSAKGSTIEEAPSKNKEGKKKKSKSKKSDNRTATSTDGPSNNEDRGSPSVTGTLEASNAEKSKEESVANTANGSEKSKDSIGSRAAKKAARKAEKAKRKQEENALVAPVDAHAVTEGEDDRLASMQAEETAIGQTSLIEGARPSKSIAVAEDDTKKAKAARKAEKDEKKRLKGLREIQNGANRPATVADGSKEHSNSSIGQLDSKSIPSPYMEDPDLSSLPQSEIDTFLSTSFISITDPISTKPLRPIVSFSYLPSSTMTEPSPFTDFKAPTPIQAAAWPFLLSKRDVIGVAETGSGKTLAFGIPCIRSILSSQSASPKPKSKSKSGSSSAARAVIVSPTRELAVQIHDQLSALAKPASLSTACIYGGVPKDPQRLALTTAHIIVATPGRLNDLIEEGAADLSQVTYLVLDEADRMLDKGFEDAIRTIISHTPPTTSGRQTLMFTATWPPSVRDLASTFMHSPVHISIGADNPTGELRANTRITQKVEVIDPSDKQSRLLQLIKQHQGTPTSNNRILIFALYKKEAVRIESFLLAHGLRAAAIHGDLPQPARSAALAAFKAGSTPLLVATDVAARGLDIPSVKLVLNATFPLTAEDYVHRIGRTGRAGADGLAITLFTVHDKAMSGALINVLRAAGQEVPEELLRFGGTVKRKEHDAYGAFVRDLGDGKRVGTKIRFD